MRYCRRTTQGVVRILVSWKKPTELKVRDRLERTMLEAKNSEIGSRGVKGRRVALKRRYVGCEEQASRTRKVIVKWYIAVDTWQCLS